MESKESGSENVVQTLVSNIIDWNINGNLPEGFELPDGVSRVREVGFYDHGNRILVRPFNNMSDKYNYARSHIRTSFPNSRVVTIFGSDRPGCSVIRYELKWNAKGFNIRAAEEGSPGFVEFLMPSKSADQVLESMRENPNTLDSMIDLKFPKMNEVAPRVYPDGIILLPNDATPQTYKSDMSWLLHPKQ